MRLAEIVILVGGIAGAAVAGAADPMPAGKLPGAAEVRHPRAKKPPLVPVPEPSPLALQYYRTGNVLWAVRELFAVAVPAVILWTGFSARIRDWARRIGRRWLFIIAVYFILYTLVDFVVSLPLAYYAQYVRQHAYGLSNQTLGKWLSDTLKELAIALVAGALLLWVPYLLVTKSPRRWWLYTGLLSVPFTLVTMLIFPIWIAPLFNQFGPMKDKALEARILALADRAGIEGSRVFEVDKSVDTKTVNAYVAGLLNTKRIVLWDTLIAKLDQDELMAVMAHEMGHYVLNHVAQGIVVGAASVVASLYLVYRLSGLLIARFKERFGFERLADVASWPLIVLLMEVATLAILPLGLAFSRHLEREADRFSLELTQNNHATAMAFVKLQQENLAHPRPGVFYWLWRGSHPSLAERIEFANTYRPWEQGQPLRYGRYFRAEHARN